MSTTSFLHDQQVHTRTTLLKSLGWSLIALFCLAGLLFSVLLSGNSAQAGKYSQAGGVSPVKSFTPVTSIPLTNTLTATITGTPPTPFPTPTNGISCTMAWHDVNIPDGVIYGNNLLNGVAAVASNDVWAVGFSTDVSNTQSLLIEHWDGEQWNIVPAPAIEGDNPILNGIWAASPSNIWAVGSYVIGQVSQTLTIQWDGTQWVRVLSPDPGGSGSLNKVGGLSGDDVWAIGSTVLHWDGTQWILVTYPAGGELTDISAVSANDVWVVGSTSSGGIEQTFTMHWDGAQWSVVPSPDAGAGDNYLEGVTAISANDIWAVGYYSIYQGGFNYGPLLMHWDGTTWSVSGTRASPSPPAGTNLNSVVALASDDVWAVGGAENGAGGFTVAMHWDGSTWSNVYPIDGRLYAFEFLSSVSGLTDGTLWAVGMKRGYGPASTLAKEYASTIFTDVPQGSTFYPHITCLACKGIVSGYSDGTFRPNKFVTRGQIAKIVALSSLHGTSRQNSKSTSGKAPSYDQVFEDVAPGSPFFDYIYLLSGQMAGYPCGGQGEPCVPPGNLPFFRPNSTATRGELAKIVSNAANFNDNILPDTQTFTDVPEGSTFYTYTERLVLNRPGVMQGYPCGGPVEPCDPENRSYFRPGNKVTRGRSPEVVSNTFFPDCQ